MRVVARSTNNRPHYRYMDARRAATSADTGARVPAPRTTHTSERAPDHWSSRKYLLLLNFAQTQTPHIM